MTGSLSSIGNGGAQIAPPELQSDTLDEGHLLAILDRWAQEGGPEEKTSVNEIRNYR